MLDEQSLRFVHVAWRRAALGVYVDDRACLSVAFGFRYIFASGYGMKGAVVAGFEENSNTMVE